MNTLNLYPFCEALATGLLHSLWLFPVLAGLDWLVVRWLSASRYRYVAHLLTLLTCLTAFLGLVGFRWWTITRAYADATFLQLEIGTPLATELTNGFEVLGLRSTTDWTIYLAIAYAVGLIIFLLRYLRRYRDTRRMRRGGLLPDPAQRQLFAALRKEIYPRGRVDWRITDRVRNVLVVGVLRPVVLFPVGLVNQLTAEEVAAVLRHELIHLRRNDPFWNTVQEVVRTLFFYHPVVYWLCRELDREREYACDDAVLRQTDPKTYARALLRVADYSLHPKIPLTMAATSSPDFTQRVKRLFSPAAQRSTLPFLIRPSWHSSLALLPLLLLLTYAVANPYQLTGQTAGSARVTGKEEIVLTGTVVDGDTDQPLIGTAIVVRGQKIGTVTDLDGAYKLRVPAGSAALSFSYTGYESVDVQLIRQDQDEVINVKLHHGRPGAVKMGKDGAKFLLLDPTERKRESLGAAQPDKPMEVRGLNLAANDRILYLIDGVAKEESGLETIFPQDIESIEVFKKKSDIAKFGYGTNYDGVISIRMKKKD